MQDSLACAFHAIALYYQLRIGNIHVVLRLDACTILAQIPYVFDGGEHCPNIRPYHNTCVVEGLDDHTFLAQSTCKLYEGEKCKSFGTDHSIVDSQVGSADALAFCSPIENIWYLGKNCKSICTSHPTSNYSSYYWVTNSELYASSHWIQCCRLISPLHSTLAS